MDFPQAEPMPGAAACNERFLLQGIVALTTF